MFSPTTALMLSTNTNIKRFCTTQIKVSLLQYLHQQLKKSKVQGELWFVKECVQSPGTKTVSTTSCSGCSFSISVRLTRMRQYLCYLNHNVTKSNITSQEQQLLKVKRVAMQQNKSRSSDVRRNVCFIVNLTVFVSEN